MLRNVFLKTLRDRRRSLVGWVIGLVGMSVFSVALYPSVRANAEDFARLTEDLPPSITALVGGELDFASAHGYLHSRFFALLGPLLLIIFSVGFGARTVAGEEQDGTLELVAASPVPRRVIAMQKLAALVTSVTVLAIAMWVSLAWAGAAVDLAVPSANLGGAVLAAALLALTFGALAFVIGCASGKRARASAVASVAAVGTYLLSAYSSLVEALRPYRYASPWHFYDSAEVLRSGLEPGDALILLAAIVGLSTAGILALDRRDLGV